MKPARTTAARAGADALTWLRRTDGRVTCDTPSPARQRAIHLGLLHGHSEGLVEIAAGPRRHGRLALVTREDPASYLPGGAGTRGEEWLRTLQKRAAQHDAHGFELFVGVAVRRRASGRKRAVDHARWLWVDVDGAEKLPALREFLAERPAQLLVASGGSGGAHAYWRLAHPLPAEQVDSESGEVTEWIERANTRLVHALGTDASGQPCVADPACTDRGRVLRLAGSVNGKTGQRARILHADLAHPGWTLEDLVGDLPDPAGYHPRRAVAVRRPRHNCDEFALITPPDYMRLLAGRELDRRGYVRCPAHRPDHHPSCRVWDEPERGWFCWVCRAGGDIYHLASLLAGGPGSGSLSREQFLIARAYLRERLAG